MKSSKLASILDSLSKKEWKQFKDYVASPFFNKNELLSQLLQIIAHVYFNHSKQDFPTKQYLWRKLFPKNEYDEARLLVLMSKLNKLGEAFLTYQAAEERPMVKLLYWLQQCNKRQLMKHLQSSKKEALKLASLQYDHDTFFHEQFMLFAELSYLEEKQDLQLEKLSQAGKLMDYHYIVNKLKHYCHQINASNIYYVKDTEDSREEFLNYMDNIDTSSVIPIKVYKQLLDLLTNPEIESHYFTFRKLLDENKDSFILHEWRSLYIFAQNYCIRKINQGSQEFLEELFELNKHLLETELLYEEGVLGPQNYKNLATVALRLQKYDWAERFIKDYKDRVNPKYREYGYYYNMGSLHFYKQNYDEAKIALREVGKDDFYYTLGAKSLLLRTYYESEDWDAFYSLTHSFTNLIRRNKYLSDNYKESYLNMIKFFTKIANLNYGEQEKALKLKEQLENTTGALISDWLLAKIEEKYMGRR